MTSLTWLWLVACVAPTPGDTGSDADSSSDSEWTAALAQERLQARLDDAFPDPRPLLIGFLDALTYGDEDCPGSATSLPGSTLTGCTADSGWSYSGIAELALDEQHFDLHGDFQLHDPDGAALVGGGGLYHDTRQGWFMLFMGTWRDETAADWRRAGVSALLSAGSDATALLWVDGAYAIGAEVLAFEQFMWSREGCAPAGALLTRSDEGRWIRLDLAPDCSSCGIASDDDRELGEICVDTTHLETQLLALKSPHGVQLPDSAASKGDAEVHSAGSMSARASSVAPR